MNTEIVEERLMSQDEIADKYDEERSMVCNALKMYDVNPVDKSKTKTKRTNLYREIDAVMALVQLYRKRRDDFLNHALKWQHAEELALKIYMESYGEIGEEDA